MFQHVFRTALPLSLIAVLAACGNGEKTESVIRPAMVVQPVPSTALMDTYPGEVRARYEPDLAFRIGGKVIKRQVDVGDRVKKGQALAELDPQDVRLQLESARAQVASAQANLQLVKAERDRYKTLQGRQLVSRSQYDNAENLYRAGVARLKQAQADFNVANNQSGYAVLAASQDGVIAQRFVEVGQVVAGGQTVFSLAADGEREVRIDLPEQAYGRYPVGQPVEIELWSQPGKRFNGHIREMSPAADAQSRTFATRVAFDAGDIPAELGQSARVFIAREGEVALAIPLSALTADAGKPYVWVVDPQSSTLKRTAVRVGPYSDNSVPVLAGLKADDWVVAAGTQVLQEGQQVKPLDRENRAIKLTAKE
ncbi:efflux RND transporter periplasmic adaptor subunit [Pseudomonas segetis]|uniref:Membrane fusion protein, multidrug efflux system n=1 Tax=Pseudomonas segetis TaxID=298908 RepID=A0A238ZKQ6_9PSED|nr:efflux RND transporter periplasmic adaptor subunit [Pseudomonas segetis]SNR84026.1 membrane fusion protein, multidrug efflux system [Pseudomonas segetis]